MSRDTLNTQFWKACKILRQDDNTNSLLDYVEQISWLLFLKCFEELEEKQRAEADFEGREYSCSRFGRVELLISSHPAQAGLFSTRPGENPA